MYPETERFQMTRLTLSALSAQLDDGLVKREVAVDVSSGLLVVLVTQGGLDTISAELQIKNIICSPDRVVQSFLKGTHLV